MNRVVHSFPQGERRVVRRGLVLLKKWTSVSNSLHVFKRLRVNHSLDFNFDGRYNRIVPIKEGLRDSDVIDILDKIIAESSIIGNVHTTIE